MGSTKWTEDQLKAITTRECNLLVAAAAGSGKTAVLVERIIRIITNEDNPIDIDRLLVVTFTNAAASEMRERVLEAIYKKLDEEPDNENLQKQIILLGKSNICTIHSFCLDVIKNNFFEIDLSANFRIAAEEEIELLKQEVLDDVLENPPNAKLIIIAYARDLSAAKLTKLEKLKSTEKIWFIWEALLFTAEVRLLLPLRGWIRKWDTLRNCCPDRRKMKHHFRKNCPKQVKF